MRKQFFLYYMILVVIGITITGFFTSQLARSFYKSEVEEKLKNTTYLLKAYVSEELTSKGSVDYDMIAKKYSGILSDKEKHTPNSIKAVTRITFIDKTGKVLGESETDYRNMENHLSRKEVQEALQGKLGEDIRSSNTLSVDFLYIAALMDSSEVVVRVSVPLVQIRNINDIMFLYTLLGIVAGLILTSLLAYMFSSSITRPLNELIVHTREIAAGNYSKQVNIKTKNEVGQLANTFNQMTAKLDKTMFEIVDKNLKVESIIDSMPSGIVAVDIKSKVILINSIACQIFGIRNAPSVLGMNIVELIRNSQVNSFLKESIDTNQMLTNEITIGVPQERILRIYTTPIRSKDIHMSNSGGLVFIQDITNIRKLEQIRTEFVSNVTHELKTPLTSIRGFIETLRAGAINDSDVAGRFLEIIDIEAERLYTLINDILQLSEIESKQKDINIGLYNLKPIVEDTISILQGTAEKKHVSIETDIDASVKINANRNRIKQMLINLIENAIKYNVENGSISIKAYRTEGKIIISVKDTGIGIPNEYLPRIFERFYRVDKGRSRNMGGTGLGLSIVKHIVNLYSGDIKVYSTPGEGTEFVISLPV